jgi:predicted metal-binding membrane protein
VTLRALERAAWRHPEWTAAAVAASAWLVLIVAPQAGDDGAHAQHAHASATPWLGTVAWWLLMSTAMMVPAALPAVRHAALTSMWHRRRRVVALFLAPYLGLWLGFGIVALASVGWLRRALDVGSLTLLIVVLVAAAAWELTPMKRRSLRACHLFAPLPPRGLTADAACVTAGLRYGCRSLAGCWALMLTMAVAGPRGLLLMAFLTVVIAAQKVLVRGTRLGRPASVALLGAAAAVLAA